MRRRKKSRSEPNLGVGDAELPRPDGSSSFMSVLNFSARPFVSIFSAPPTSTVEGESSVAESEDNVDELSDTVPILSSVNGVPHNSVSIHVPLPCTSNNKTYLASMC